MQSYALKCILVGDSGVGKSQLSRSFLNKEFIDNSPSTVGIEFASRSIDFEKCIIKAQVWDTAGQERFAKMTKAYYKNAVAAVLVYDICNLESFNNIRKVWMPQIREYSGKNIRLILVGNKTDLVTSNRDASTTIDSEKLSPSPATATATAETTETTETKAATKATTSSKKTLAGPVKDRKVSAAEGRAYAEEQNIDFIETSALSGYCVEIMFRRIFLSVGKELPDVKLHLELSSLPTGWMVCTTPILDTAEDDDLGTELDDRNNNNNYYYSSSSSGSPGRQYSVQSAATTAVSNLGDDADTDTTSLSAAASLSGNRHQELVAVALPKTVSPSASASASSSSAMLSDEHLVSKSGDDLKDDVDPAPTPATVANSDNGLDGHNDDEDEVEPVGALPEFSTPASTNTGTNASVGYNHSSNNNTSDTQEPVAPMSLLNIIPPQKTQPQQQQASTRPSGDGSPNRQISVASMRTTGSSSSSSSTQVRLARMDSDRRYVNYWTGETVRVAPMDPAPIPGLLFDADVALQEAESSTRKNDVVVGGGGGVDDDCTSKNEDLQQRPVSTGRPSTGSSTKTSGVTIDERNSIEDFPTGNKQRTKKCFCSIQ